MKKKKFLCFISARGGSTGIKNKNIMSFCGKPLISWTILQAKKSKILEDIHISTDSIKIAKIAEKYGGKIPFIRKKNLANKNTSKFLVWKNALLDIEKKKKIKYDYFFDLDCTNPLRSPNDIDKMINHFLKNSKNIDALITVSNSRKNPYFNMLEKNNSNFLKLSKKLIRWPTSRQTSPDVYDQVASMYLLKTDFLRKKTKLYDGNLKGYLLKDYQNFDIDSQLDYKIVSFLFKKYYLKKTKKFKNV
jgi:CMP-N,N'-diacetyllegionaminic acid synthase